jgi:hypothetical protein
MSSSGAVPWWDPTTAADAARLLAHRRWWSHQHPFRYVHAMNVFRPDTYLELERAFTEWEQGAGGGRPLAGHDLQGVTVTSSFEGPLRLFASSGWHRLLARVFALAATPHVNLGLHHHQPNSLPGFPHTDLNPGWFPAGEAAGDGSVQLADPAVVEYTTGRSLGGSLGGDAPGAVQVVRAVAVIFYLANPVWEPEHRGETGLYTCATGEVDEPVASIAPHCNSLLAFECTPWSFHGFQGGGSVPRNSVVQWLHRRPTEAVERWGPHAVVGYGATPR